MIRIHITVDLEDAIRKKIVEMENEQNDEGANVDYCEIWIEALEWVLKQSIELD